MVIGKQFTKHYISCANATFCVIQPFVHTLVALNSRSRSREQFYFPSHIRRQLVRLLFLLRLFRVGHILARVFLI